MNYFQFGKLVFNVLMDYSENITGLQAFRWEPQMLLFVAGAT